MQGSSLERYQFFFRCGPVRQGTWNSRDGSLKEPNSPTTTSFAEGSGEMKLSPKPASRGFLPRFNQFNKSLSSWAKAEGDPQKINTKLSSLN